MPAEVSLEPSFDFLLVEELLQMTAVAKHNVSKIMLIVCR